MTHTSAIVIAGKGQLAIECFRISTMRGLPVYAVPAERDFASHWDGNFAVYIGTNHPHCVRKLDEFRDDPDALIISAKWDQRIPASEFATSRIFNLHYSLLPRHRGMYPCAWAILAGDKETGVTLHQVDDTFDTGPIVAQAWTGISEFDTARSLYDRQHGMAGDLYREWAARLIAGTYELRPQGELREEDVWDGRGYHRSGSINFEQTDVRDLGGQRSYAERWIRAFYFPPLQTGSVGSAETINAHCVPDKPAPRFKVGDRVRHKDYPRTMSGVVTSIDQLGCIRVGRTLSSASWLFSAGADHLERVTYTPPPGPNGEHLSALFDERIRWIRDGQAHSTTLIDEQFLFWPEEVGLWLRDILQHHRDGYLVQPEGAE